jgi:16S rRNA (guanine527-N7)-methyltransferase
MAIPPEQFAPYLSGLAQAGAEQHLQLARYLALVDEYRRVLNLTAFGGKAGLADELVMESARLLDLLPQRDGLRCVDLGSGVGSPVVPLALLRPGLSFMAIEARERRAAFLRQVNASLKPGNLEVRCQRAEQLIAEAPGAFDVVCARAFAKPAVLFEFADRLLGPQGLLLSFYGPQIGEVEAAAAAAGLRLDIVLPYEHGGLLRHAYRACRAI